MDQVLTGILLVYSVVFHLFMGAAHIYLGVLFLDAIGRWIKRRRNKRRT